MFRGRSHGVKASVSRYPLAYYNKRYPTVSQLCLLYSLWERSGSFTVSVGVHLGTVFFFCYPDGYHETGHNAVCTPPPPFSLCSASSAYLVSTVPTYSFISVLASVRGSIGSSIRLPNGPHYQSVGSFGHSWQQHSLYSYSDNRR